jgi:outer membrane autotransporter protein
MMGAAAATALIAAAPAFSADAPTTQPTELQAAIRDILGTPLTQIAWRENVAAKPETPRFYAISIGNDDDIVVGPGETALSQADSVEDIDLVNTGNLTGGIGIEVSTGEVNPADFIADRSHTSYTVGEAGGYVSLYDDAGNVVSYGYPTATITTDEDVLVLNTQSLDSRISIANSGSIAFSGRNGIKASNLAGESITITNSGDITSTQDTAGRTGIYASTETYLCNCTATLTDPGEFTYNANGQLTGVIEPDEVFVYYHLLDMAYDGGAINIHNTGDIDLGDVAGKVYFGEMHSAGIYTRGDGETTIDNEGDIRVGKGSAGIRVSTIGATSVTNSGRIDVGNLSSGISIGISNGYANASDYRLGGDVYVLNTGDIFGGVTKAEADPGDLTTVAGIHVTAMGSNNEFMAGMAHANERYAEYNELLGSDVYPLFDVPKLRLYDITTVNRGHIEVQDGGHGISIMPLAGHSTAINEGTIIAGDGRARFQDNVPFPSAGVYQSNFPVDGPGSTTTINAQTGIVVTGDNSIGIGNLNYFGDSTVINEGSITTGNGVSQLTTTPTEGTFDRLFRTYGLLSICYAHTLGTLSFGRNSGEITVGELAIGSAVAGHGYSLLDSTAPSAININDGIISTGDNSTGMSAFGTNTTAFNTGSITTGSYDISAFQPHPTASADEFASLRFGAVSTAGRFAEVINYGTITTGDGKIGASAHSAHPGIGLAARVLQNADGVITTGDHSIGAQVFGNRYSFFASEGRISVGDDSIGVEVTSGDVTIWDGQTTANTYEGSLSAINAGIVETGDNSVGIRMNGVREDVPYTGRLRLPYPDNPYYYYDFIFSGVADVTSPSYLHNSGTVRVGVDSTGVDITGTAADELPLLFNTGTIDAAQSSSTAIRANSGNDLGSFVVNVGTVIGNVTFGAGDDRFTNTLMVDNSGRVTHNGTIIMNGSVIDFGAGENTFDNDRGMVMLAGGDNLITGANVVMTQGSIEARNNAVDSSLTIDGNLSGGFAFGADFNGSGSDQLIITGDVAADSSMSLVLNPTEQVAGETTVTVISVGGENNADAPIIEGVTGNFADSLLGAEASLSETGDVIVTARFGMGHMGTSAASATTMAQQWWMQSVGSLGRRDMQQLAGLEDTGVSAWIATFHEEGSVDPINDLQDVSFDQKLSGLQTGIEWKGDVGGGSLSVGPMFSYGNASANPNANVASAMGDASAYGLNAGYRFSNGLYLNATWQQMAMEIDFRTPGTFSNATGTTDAEGDGFNLELGYAHKLQSGLTLAPQLQYASVTVDLDDFTTSDGVYALTGLGGKHSLLRAGLSVFKTFETKNGSITPLVDVSYLDAMDGDSTLSSNGVLFSNDTSGSGYRAEFGIAGRYKSWDITGRVGLAETTSTQSALSSSLSVRYRW